MSSTSGPVPAAPDATDAALRASRRRGIMLVGTAALLWSTGGLIVRSLEQADTWTTVFWRALTAFLFLFVFVLVRERSKAFRAFVRIGLPGIVIAVCYAVASMALIIAFSLTSVANTLVIMSSAPILAALLGWAVLGERVGVVTWIAMLIAMAGIAIMVSETTSRGSLWGDLAAGSIALAQAIAGVTLRRHRHVQMAPAMCLSTLMTFAIAVPYATPLAVTTRDLVLLTIFGAGQLGLGLALFSFGAPLIPVAEVALLNVLEPILGPLWVWLVLGERPGEMALIGGAIVLGALLMHILGERHAASK